MTRARLRQLLASLAHDLGLAGWAINLDFDTPPTTTTRTAEVEFHRNYDWAAIRVDPGWREWTESESIHTLAHELFHLLHRDVDEAARAASMRLGSQARAVWDDAYDHALEGFVDRCAVALAKVVTG